MAIGCFNHTRVSIGHRLRNVSFIVDFNKNSFLLIGKTLRCQAVQNLGLAVISMVSGMIVDNGGYFMLEIFFIGWLSSK